MFNDLKNKEFVEFLYKTIHLRSADDSGLKHYTGLLDENLSRENLIKIFLSSDEYLHKNWQWGDFLHESRKMFINLLPKAKNIIDLGGTDLNTGTSALLKMGYPYDFDKITVVDLPNELRHERYRCNLENKEEKVDFLYCSMKNLSAFPDESIDLVFSGESIEHITEEDLDITLREIRRVLKPKGYFCFDTPNSKITRIQQDNFIDPDHKIEYSSGELEKKLSNNYLNIEMKMGLHYVGEVVRKDFENPFKFKTGIFHSIDECYLLAYICRK